MIPLDLELNQVRRVLARAFAAVVMPALCAAASSGDSNAPLIAPNGMTAISGRVLTNKGEPLEGIVISVHGRRTKTDALGRYLLVGTKVGDMVLAIDGTHITATRPVDYGIYLAHVRAWSGLTTQVAFTHWLTPVDHSHDIPIGAPTAKETIIETPSIPGFRLTLDQGVTIRDAYGTIVKSVTVNAVPSNRTPFPVYTVGLQTTFNIQPEGACLYSHDGGPGKAHLILPNSSHESPGARRILTRFDPETGIWTPFAIAAVGTDGSQLVPEGNSTLSSFGASHCESRRGDYSDPSVQAESDGVQP